MVSAGGLLSDWTHGCLQMRLCPIHVERTSRRGADVSSSRALRLVCKLGDAGCARPVNGT